MTSRRPHYKADNNSNLIKYDKDKDTIIIKPMALNIIWGGDSRYWKLSQKEEGSVELIQVSWLEVTGQIDLNKFLKKGKEYMVKFRMELRPDQFGWGDYPVYFMVKVAQENRLWRKAYLKSKRPGEIFDVPIDRNLIFRVPDRCGGDDKLVFGMYEIWKGRWKGGLVIHEVIIAPASLT